MSSTESAFRVLWRGFVFACAFVAANAGLYLVVQHYHEARISVPYIVGMLMVYVGFGHTYKVLNK